MPRWGRPLARPLTPSRLPGQRRAPQLQLQQELALALARALVLVPVLAPGSNAMARLAWEMAASMCRSEHLAQAWGMTTWG